MRARFGEVTCVTRSVSWATAAAIVLWGACRRVRLCGERRKRHETMRDPMERSPGGGNDGRPKLGPSFWRNAVRATTAPLRRQRRPRRPPSLALSSHGGSRRRRLKRPASNVGAKCGSERHEAMREPMERRQGGADDRGPDMAAVSGAMPCKPLQAPRPLPRAVSLRRQLLPKRPLLSRARHFRGGVCWPPRRPRTPAPLQRRERASTRPSFRRARPAHQTRSCGSTRRRASTTTRARTTMGTRAGAPICAKPMRRRADFAPLGSRT